MDMMCELFFDINGPPEEQDAVARKIAQFFRKLEVSGDIAEVSGLFEGVELVEFQAPI